jgi:hypothetical protein
MKSKDITNKLTEWTDPMDMLNRGRRGAEMGGGPERGGFGGYTGGPSPFGGGGASRSAAKKEFGKEQSRTATMSPAQKQAEKEVRSGQFSPSPAPKKGEEPIPKRETPPELTRSSPEVSRIPAQQRKAQAEKSAAEKTAEKEPVTKTKYQRDADLPIVGKKTTTGPKQLTPQEKAEELLKGQGFKKEPGSVSGSFKPRKSEPKKADKEKTEPAKAEPAKAEPTPQEPAAPKQRTTLGGDPIPPGHIWNPKTGKYDPPPSPSALKDLAAIPGGIARSLNPQDRKAAATSVGGHAALLAYLLMSPEEKKAAAEKSQSAQRGDSEKPITINFIDPGSEPAADAPASVSPDSKAITTTTSSDSQVDSDKSLPPVVVTAKPEPVKPEKKQPENKEEIKKREEPKDNSEVMATTEPSSWEVEKEKEEEKAEADKVDDEKNITTTQAVPEPEEDEDDLIKKLLKNLFSSPEPEPVEKSAPTKEPDSEPAKEPEAPKAEPKPEPEKKSQDDSGRADAQKGNLINYGDERIAYPKFDQGERNELPRDSEKTGSDTRTRKTDSDTDRGPAASGKDNTTNYAPPAPEKSNQDNDRSSRVRERLRQRREREFNPELQDFKRMTPDVNESLNHILGLANITKKEIVESTTMNLDMRQMIALLDEATKMADIKGKKHTGKYGKEYDTDEEGDDKPKAKEKNKRGGQESEATKDAKKWQGADAAGAAIIGGKAPSSAAKGTKHGFTAGEKAAKKAEKAKSKKNLKDWFDSTEEAILEGAKVDRMVKHIAKSERDLGKGKKEAENIAWATANKRGYLDNKNKKKVKEESYTVNKKPVSKGEYDATMKAAGKSPSPPEKVKEELKGDQKNLDVAAPKGKLDAKDFAALRAKKKVSEAEKAKKDYDGDGKVESPKDEVWGSRMKAAKKAGKLKEGVNFAEMMKETQMSIEEMLEGLQQEIAEFKATGHMGDNLRDALEIHRYKGKDKLMGESPMMSQTVVEEPLEENPFTYAARQAKASGDDSFKLGGETFPVKEAMSRHAKGYAKFGPEGMKTLARLGQQGASEKTMDAARKEFNKYDNDEKVDEDGPGAARMYGDDEKSDFDVVDSMKKFANKGIDAWNDYEQSKKDAWDSRRWNDGSGGKPGSSGYNPSKLPRFDTKDDNYPDELKRGIKSASTTPSPKREPESDIFDREKPYRDKTGKMVTPPKGLSISEPYGKKGYPDAVDVNAPSKNKDRKPMKENFDFSLWDSQLEKMINESLTVTTTQGDNDTENSVSITASGEQAGEIMALLRNAGMDSMSGPAVNEPVVVEPEQLLSAYGVPMSQDDNSGSGHDDIVSLMQKLSGMSDHGQEGIEMSNDSEHEEHDDQNSHDYEDEGSEDENEEKDEAEEGSDEEDNNDEEKVNEEREISTSVDDEGRIHYMRDPKNPSPQKSSVDDRGRLQFKDTDRPNSSSVDDQDRIHYMRDPKNPSPQRSSVDDKGRLQFKDTDRPQQSSVDDKGRLQFKGDTAGPQRSSVDDKGRLQYKGPSAGAQQSSVDDQGRLRFVKEYDEEMTNEGMCQECGMYEGECGHRMNEAEGTYADPKGHIFSSNGKTEYVPAPGYRVRTTFTPGRDDPTTTFVKADSTSKETSKDQNSKETSKDQKNENLESARPIEEELANGADDTTMQDIKYLIRTLAGGLNKEKRDQTTLPHTAVKVTESREMLNEWKKLSGIK